MTNMDTRAWASAFIGYSDCGCNAGWKRGVVLDPFFGSGTVGVTALKSNRHFIGIEMNADYIRIAKKRLRSIPTGSNITPVEFNAQTLGGQLRDVA
jgi:tRNA G10  N-methylase Trm11